MIQEVVNLKINGQTEDDLVPDVAEIEIEEHVDSADVFRVRISVTVDKDGTWTYLDDDRFSIWNRLAIQCGYPADNAVLIDGYITHVRASLQGTGAGDSYLELTGMDVTAMMDLEEKQVAWPNKKDSDIAQQIFGSYGLSWEVEDTTLVHGEAVATILQSESDIRFLRRLAARNGFECYVLGGKGFFRGPNLQAPPQNVLALEFGSETNLGSLSFEIDGVPPTDLEIRRIDPLGKSEDIQTLGSLPRRQIGAQTLSDLRGAAGDGRRTIKSHPATDPVEMQSELRAGYEGAAEFVTASGEIDSRAYQAMLRAKRLVTIKGAGALFSGLYYVSRVRHHFTPEGYTQRFEAYRNGIGLTGDEQFAQPPALVPIVPGAAASVDTGNRVLPAQQSTSSLPGES